MSSNTSSLIRFTPSGQDSRTVQQNSRFHSLNGGFIRLIGAIALIATILSVVFWNYCKYNYCEPKTVDGWFNAGFISLAGFALCCIHSIFLDQIAINFDHRVVI